MKPEREQRSESREHASGTISLRYRDVVPVVIDARLVDISPQGFRVEHRDRNLQSGQIVQFSAAHGEGEAQVVWTRQVGENLQSGLRLIEPSPGAGSSLRLDP